jgi:hypothetical protein
MSGCGSLSSLASFRRKPESRKALEPPMKSMQNPKANQPPMDADGRR